MPTTTDIKQGVAVVHKDQAWLITYAQFVNPGKGAAFTRAKLKNLKTGQTVEVTYKSGEAVETVDVQHKKCQYLYKDASAFYFMETDTYEQFSLDKDQVGDNAKWLLDGTECFALVIDNNPVSIQLPPKMDFTVVTTTPGVKGDTATGGSKEATIETGVVVKVPLFIKEGEKIKINTEDGTYVSKA